MDLLCPNCESTLTPSVMGYLCIDCGAVHKFYRTPDGTPVGPNVKRSAVNNIISENIPLDSSTSPSNHQPANHTDSIQYQRRLRTRLKQMVVPELPSALDEPELRPADRPLLNPVPDSNVFQPALYSDEENVAPPQEAELLNGISSTQDPVTPKKNHLAKKIFITILVTITIMAVGAAITLLSRKKSAPPKASELPTSSSTTETANNLNAPAAVIDHDNQRKRDLKEIGTALEVYKQDSGAYPVGTDISAVYPLQYTNPPYIKFVNYDPSSTEAAKVKYSYSSDGKTFTLKAKLENPQDSDAKDGYFVITGS